tara:strand:+ start:475 stop:1500 length:1026 start_codon:yes stop_codon:yes gene_type:complete
VSRLNKNLIKSYILLLCIVLWGDLSNAQDELQEFIKKGDYFAQAGRFKLAIAEYEKALAAGAGSAAVLNRLGEFYLQVGEFDKGVEVFKRSLGEKPGQVRVYSKLGEAFLASGRLDSAIYYVEEAHRLIPDDSSVYSSLGLLYLQADQGTRAKALLDTALFLDARNPEAHRFLGLYFTYNDSLTQAIEHYLTLAEILPQDVEAYNNLAFLHGQKKQYTQAIAYYKQAMDLAGDPLTRHAISRNLDGVRAIMDGKMRARYILVKTEPEARDLLERIKKGEDFGQLAQRFSQAPNAELGGDVGFFGTGDLMDEFEQAVLKLEVGDVSELVTVPVGVMIIQRLN